MRWVNLLGLAREDLRPAITQQMTDSGLDAVWIAFGVVVLTTLGNTLLEWFRQSQTASREARSLRRALMEELRVYRDTAQANIQRAGEPEPGGSFIIPVTEHHPIYEANIGKLGRLRPDEVSAVVKAYAHLHAMNENLAVMGSFHRTEGPVLHAVVDSKWSPVLSANTRELRDLLAQAVEALQGPAARSPTLLGPEISRGEAAKRGR